MAVVAAQPSVTSFGLVSPEGIVVPFAVHDGQTWVKAWREPDDPIDNDRSLEAHVNFWRTSHTSPPDRWTLVGAPAGMRPLRVLTHVAFDDHCQRQIGLLTDYRETAPRGDHHFRRMVFNGNVTVLPPLRLRTTAAEKPWADLIVSARNAFATEEAAAVRKWTEGGGKLPITREALARRPIRFVSLYAADSGGVRTLYFEAERAYGAPLNPSDRQCGGLTRVRGWVTAAAGSAPGLSEVYAGIDDCDAKTGATLLPLGVATVGGKTVWLASEHYYESEAYFVIETSAAGVKRVHEARGGGC